MPSGHCNFSRVSKKTLEVTTNVAGLDSLRVYGVNHNVLRFEQSSARLLFEVGKARKTPQLRRWS